MAEEVNSPDEALSVGDPTKEDLVRRRLESWSLDATDKLLQLAAERALVLVDPSQSVLRRVLPMEIRLKLANGGIDVALYSFRDAGTDDVLADIVLDQHSVGPMGEPPDLLAEVTAGLLECSIALIESIRTRLPREDIQRTPGLTVEWRDLLLTSAEAIIAELVSLRTELVRSLSQGTAISPTAVETAATALETHFADVRDAESTRARNLLVASSLILIIITALGLMSLLRQPIFEFSGPDWYTAIHLSAIVLPIYGLAAFLIRESTKHRGVALWATRLSAQLQSIGPFVRSFVGSSGTQQDTRDLWMAFGKDNVFAPERNGQGNVDATELTDTVRQITEIVTAITKQTPAGTS